MKTDRCPGCGLELMGLDRAASYCGLARASFSTYVSRGYGPKPDVKIGGSPAWTRATLREWKKNRPGQGAGGGRPRQ